MSTPALTHHSGWPWPLDAVQDWFAGFWDAIRGWISDAVSAITGFVTAARDWLWGLIKPALEGLGRGLTDTINAVGVWIRDLIGWWDPESGRFVGGFLGWLWDSIGWLAGHVSSGLGWIRDTLMTYLMRVVPTIFSELGKIWNAVKGFGEWVVEGMGEIGGWLKDVIWGWVDGALRWASDSFRWLNDQISGGLAWTVDSVGRMFDGAQMVLGDALTSLFTDPLGALSGGIGWFTGSFGAVDPGDVGSQTTGLFDAIGASYARLLGAHSPLTAEEAYTATHGWMWEQRSHWYEMYLMALIIEGASLGQVEAPIHLLQSDPQVAASMDLATKWFAAPYEYGYSVLLEQYWNKAYTPKLPPAPDIIRMVVREAFRPEMVIAAPAEFADAMEYAGYSRVWSDRYWTAHFVPISLRQAYDNLWRGYWDKERFMYALHIADIHPMWREDIYNVAFRPLTRRELRYGWETGVVTPEKMTAAFRAMGLSPEDAAIATESSMEYALHEERMGVLREWRTDLRDGFIDEATFRANMTAIKILGIRQDFYVARATIRRERELKKDLLDIYEDQYLKDLITDEDFEERVHEIVVIPDVADLFIDKAYVKKYKKPKPPRETTEEDALKQANKYRVSYARQLYRNYAITKDEFITLLTEADVHPVVARARADYEELKRPRPKPSDVEIARAKEAARIQTLAVRTAIEEFRGYVIDEDELLSRLIEADLSEALAMARMQLESIRRPPPPIPPEEIERRRVEAEVKRLTGLALAAQYRRYAIEKEELIAGLIAAGFDPAEAAARADYEEARRPVPKPPEEELKARREERRIRKLAESEALTLFRAEKITSDELAERLRTLEYGPDLIAAIVRYEEIKLALKKAG